MRGVDVGSVGSVREVDRLRFDDVVYVSARLGGDDSLPQGSVTDSIVAGLRHVLDVIDIKLPLTCKPMVFAFGWWRRHWGAYYDQRNGRIYLNSRASDLAFHQKTAARQGATRRRHAYRRDYERRRRDGRFSVARAMKAANLADGLVRAQEHMLASRMSPWRRDRARRLVLIYKEQLQALACAERFSVSFAAKDPVRARVVHEAYHAVFYQHALQNAFAHNLRRWDVTLLDAAGVSEYALFGYDGDSNAELFAEVGAALATGLRVVLSPRVLAAFCATVRPHITITEADRPCRCIRVDIELLDRSLQERHPRW